jgi:hypothetical protein
MAKTAKAEPKAEPKAEKVDHTTTSGVQLQGKVIFGKKTGLTPKQQGQKARGELDENLQPKDEGTPPADERDPVKVIKPSMTLYHGEISAEAIAGATGEPVSIRWVQEEPTTEDGLFHSFLAYHPSAIRNTFKVDATNSVIDPTKRTYLE